MLRPHRPFAALFLLAPLALVLSAAPGDVAAQASDPAARGLDLFVDMPERAAPGAPLPLQIQAFGFPTAVTLMPLAGATIEAAWDPESLGPGLSQAPAAVKATTDAAGRVHLDVPVPEGVERDLKLLVGVTSGEHHRTVETVVKRTAAREMQLIVPDDRVVPGGATSAWVLVRNTATGEPAANEPITFELLEGGVVRHTVSTTTDAAGTAVGRLPIPWTDEPSLQWKLTARSLLAATSSAGTTMVTLSQREETPGEPRLAAKWAVVHAQPGDRVGYTLRLRDASDKPVAGATVRYWIGPKGTEPPAQKTDKLAWERASTVGTTDAAGEITGTTDTPALLRKGASTTMRVIAHADLFGRGLDAETVLEVSPALPKVTVVPEVGQLVPGIEQGLVVRVRDARDEAVVGTFVVEGDGLSERVTTNVWGDGEVRWRVPRDVGAARQVGPCAGDVAAAVTVRPTAALAQLGNRTEPFATCVSVNRDLRAMVRTEKPMVTAGSAVRLRVIEASETTAKVGKSVASPPWSMTASPLSLGGSRSAGAWLADATQSLELPLRSAAPGTWALGAIAPFATEAAHIGAGRVLVAPKIAAKLSAKLAGGRPVPLGTVEIDVDLSDGKGQGLKGSVAAILVDAFGGGSVLGLTALDTRRDLCGDLGVEREACDAFFDDPAADTLRRRVLGEQSVPRSSPEHDPGGTAKEELRQEFKRVLLSLEGAVMDATASPDSLRDAFRKEKNAFTFNPELMSLATAAMDPPPITPGGEPIALGDLLALDRQVTFDNVARRVARLKLFRVLAAVRTYRQSRALDADEPVLREPNAILRRMVAANEMNPQDLLDPWGGTMAFVKAAGARLPFLNVKGFELHAPGPDGKIGTPDDVKNPFERVVASGTPYAKAMEEDRLVDSALDMEVSQATVDAWRSVLEELTGTTLGGESFGTGGLGLTGTGSGFGSGHGKLGGSHRSKGISTGAAFWLPPQRTDDKGHVRVRVPLGDVETTWRLALVGAPDGATPAVTTLDIPSSLPLSARVESGASWIEGDEADVLITLRNRTPAAVKVTLALAAGGPATLANAADKSRAVDVPPGGAVPVTVRVRARTTGTATLDVIAKGANGLEDHTTHSWDVRSAGEVVDMTSTQWLSGSATLALAQVGPGLRPIGNARLVLERGNAAAIEAALDALDPDAIVSVDGLSYAQEAAARIARWATARRGENDPLAVRARDLVRRSIGRFLVRKEAKRSERLWSAQIRAINWAPTDLVKALGAADACPLDTTPDNVEEGLLALEAEPAESNGTVLACWDTLVSSVVEKVTASGKRAALARAVLSLAERPHRAALAATLADRLRTWVELRPSGGVTLPPDELRDRSARAAVFAALLRASALGKPAVATPDRLAAWLKVQRDAQGSYGSTFATLAAVRALLSSPAEVELPTKITVTAEGLRKELTVGPNATVEVPLGATTLGVDLVATGPGLVARLIRPGVRAWSTPADAVSSPIAFEVRWPDKPVAGSKAVLRVTASSKAGRALLADIRIPLPPGVTLAEGGGSARQIQGRLVLRPLLDAAGSETLVDIPIRIGLAGTFTVPEARARPAFEEGARSIAPARPLRVQ